MTIGEEDKQRALEVFRDFVEQMRPSMKERAEAADQLFRALSELAEKAGLLVDDSTDKAWLFRRPSSSGGAPQVKLELSAKGTIKLNSRELPLTWSSARKVFEGPELPLSPGASTPLRQVAIVFLAQEVTKALTPTPLEKLSKL